MGYIEIKEGNIILQFDENNGYLKRAVYKDNIADLDSSLWRIETIVGSTVQHIEPKDTYRFSYEWHGGSLVLLWRNELVEVRVYVDIVCDNSNWDISVNLLSENHKLNNIEFPIIGSITSISGEAEEDYLLLPWQSGLLIKNPIQNMLSKVEEIPFWLGRGGLKYENEYPSQYSFQFAAYYSISRFGYYFSTEDSDAHIKTMGFYYNGGSNGFDFVITNYMEDMGTVSSYKIPYKFVLGFFEGDWQVPAGMYRKWAVEQKWCTQRNIDKQLPQNLIKTDLWRINHNHYAYGTRTQEFFDTSVSLKESIGCELALHWYGWNKGKHDVGYPEYISEELVESGWPEELTAWNEKLGREGIVKIPYINARMWDIKEESWHAENAEEAALKDGNGNMYKEPWIDDSLKPMCPATEKWQIKVDNLSKRLINYKFDGIYFDQVASFNAMLCFDRSHPHPVGGGTWWNDSYHDMLKKIRVTMGDDKIMTTESCCETYVDLFDLFLILDTNLQHGAFADVVGGENCEAVPLFSLIYGEYALSYGAVCKFIEDVASFEFKFIRNILWGILPTVEGVEASELNGDHAQEYLSITKRGVDFYKEYKHLILYGCFKGVPSYTCDEMKMQWNTSNGAIYTREYPKVMITVWTDQSKQEVYVMYNFDNSRQLVNINGRSIDVPAKCFKVVNC